jgi:hypothetical protein
MMNELDFSISPVFFFFNSLLEFRRLTFEKVKRVGLKYSISTFPPSSTCGSSYTLISIRVSTCVHAEYGNAEREQKSGSGYLQFLFIFWLPCCEVYIYGENAMIFSIRNCAQSQTTHESASTRFFFLPPIKKGKSCAAQMSIISPLYPFSVQVFERGGGAVQPAASTKVLLCRDVSLSIDFKLLIGNFGRLEVSERGENKERLFWSTQTRFSTKRKYGSVR